MINQLEDEKKKLEHYRLKAEKDIKELPEGRLRITHTHGKPHYYWVNPREQEKYLRNNQTDIVHGLAQKSYLEDIIKIASDKIKSIEHFIKTFPGSTLIDAYQSLHPERRKLITPLISTNEEYAQVWLQQKGEGKPFLPTDPEIYTEKGERVRSKSEKIIADKLYLMKIPYKYEEPLVVPGFGKVYPDFTILNVRTRKIYYWEHLGMMDNEDYCSHAIKKIETYIRGGIFPGDSLLLTFETSCNTLDMKCMNQYIQKYLI